MGKEKESLGTDNPHIASKVGSTPNSRNPFRRAMNAFSGGESHNQQGIGTDTYAPPPGPPPSQSGMSTFAPPPGPPPSYGSYAPPPGPPPSKTDAEEPPPYDPWLSVPDNATLPPPPSLSHFQSPTSNAPSEWAESARAWTRSHPLYEARPLRPGEVSEIECGHTALTKPPNVRATMKSSRPGTWHVSTPRGTPDTILLTNLPMHAACHHDPRRTGRAHTAYFELKVIRIDTRSSADGEVDSAVAVGFVAPPYPAWRLPGWDRASLGVHGDDGRRFVNNNLGGVDFTTSFREGETVGIGMKWEPGWEREGRNRVSVFFTRDGTKTGRWDLWEERDGGGEEGDPEGLGGERDVCGAVGLFGGVEVEWRGRKDEWLYRPDLHA